MDAKEKVQLGLKMASILVVDDNPVALRIMQHTLFRGAHDVQLASSAEEAIYWLKQVQFDLLILDISMPDMDGIELLIELRQMPEYAVCPVIMLTASSQDEDRERARKAGVTLFMTKPSSSTEILENIQLLL
jgi:two-component system chemotaxis response regulator CheY